MLTIDRQHEIGSSREFKENITDLSSKEAIEALKGLNPVKFNYKNDCHSTLNLGFIAEDVPDLLARSDRKTIGSFDIVAVLTKVVQEQQQIISTPTEKFRLLENSFDNAP